MTFKTNFLFQRLSLPCSQSVPLTVSANNLQMYLSSGWLTTPIPKEMEGEERGMNRTERKRTSHNCVIWQAHRGSRRGSPPRQRLTWTQGQAADGTAEALRSVWDSAAFL